MPSTRDRLALRGDVRRAWLVFATLLASYGYFYQGEGPNQNSRFDLTRAIVDDRSFAIDPYAINTIDKAQHEGRFYSDKAPGLSFAAAPAYFVVRLFQGFRAPRVDRTRAALAWVSWLVVGGASALAGAALFLLLCRFELAPSPALLASFGFALGTHQFAYATLFVGHAFAASLALLSFALLASGGPRRIALAGLLAGGAAITEFPVAVLAVALALYGLRRHGLRAMRSFALAALGPLLLLALYNAACFGSPFALGYGRLADPGFQGTMSRGLFGLTAPTVEAVVGSLFSEFRGLLPLAPWLLFAIPGAWVLLRDERRRAEAALAGFAVIGMFLLSTSYARWDGGAALGPRHFLPGLPFLAIVAAFGLHRLAARPARWIAGGLVALSVAVCLSAVAVMPELPDVALPPPEEGMSRTDPKRPFRTFVWPLLARGQVGVKATTPEGGFGLALGRLGHEADASNLGESLGLDGALSLLPLLLLWGAAAFALRLSARGAD